MNRQTPAMATTDPIVLRSNFLLEAAHLLAVPSPAASAALGSANHRLLEDNNLQVASKHWDTHRRKTCSACGNLLIPGWSCQISSGGRPQRTPSKGKNTSYNPNPPNPSVVYNCSRCHRKTELHLQSKPRRSIKTSQKMEPSKPESTASRVTVKEGPKTPLTANASSKQRQKARKGGLQAMLEKNKAQNSSKGLDLMDFMM